MTLVEAGAPGFEGGAILINNKIIIGQINRLNEDFTKVRNKKKENWYDYQFNVDKQNNK